MDQIKAQGSPNAGSQRESLASSKNRGNEALGMPASEATDAGAADLEALRRDFSELKETLAKIVSRASDETAKSAREIGGQVSTAAGDIAARGADVASVATEQAKSWAAELENIARRNPLGALIGAVAVGILIGRMGRRN